MKRGLRFAATECGTLLPVRTGRIQLAARGLCAVVLPVALAVAAPSSASQRPDRPDLVRVATSGNYSELVEKLPITERSGAEPRVVMSLGAGRLPALRSGDRLKLSVEAQLTTNCTHRVRRCVGPPYRFNPIVEVELLLAPSKGSTKGLALTDPKRVVCRQRLPDREHHCVVVLTDAGLSVGRVDALPCEPDRCFVNLVMSAHNPAAHDDQVILVGGNKPDGAIPQDRGRINALLFRPGDGDYPEPRRSRSRVRSQLPLDLKRRVVYSQRLRGLRAGEQLEVEGEAFTSRARLPYSTRTSAQLILASGRYEVRPGPFARQVGAGGEISEANGFNCTRVKDVCITRKAGVLRIAQGAREGGRPRPMFVNLVMIVGPKRRASAKGDRQRVLRRGGLWVTRYPGPR